MHDRRLALRVSETSKKSQSEIDVLRDSTKNLGKWTNRLIPVQVASFALSVIAFLVWVALSFREKFG
jgi:hypothetical protein